MQPSTSVQVHHNERKKNYYKFRASQNDTLLPIHRIEKEDVDSRKNETQSKSGNIFNDLKEFPHLRSSGSQNNRVCFESSSNRTILQNDKPWLSVVINNKTKKPLEPFPALSENFNDGEVSLSTRKDLLAQSTSVRDTSVVKKVTAEPSKQVDTNMKGNKNSTKKVTVQPQKNLNKKKRSDPIFINFQDILTTNKIQKKTKHLKSKDQRHKDKEVLSGNILDSSNPKRSRGKHREIKKKKPTKFKITIIKERILNSKIREKTIDAQIGSDSLYLLDSEDFKEEVKIYLNKLNEKKLKNLENKKNKFNDSKILEDINYKSQRNAEIIDVDIQKKEEGKFVENHKENLKSISDSKEEEIPHIIPQIIPEGEVKFSSKFREYCDNIITPDLNSAVSEFIKELIKLQDKLFSRDPVKAKIKKRHVSGIREVRKYLGLKKVKMIIIAPNLEKLQIKGSIFDAISELKSMADSQNVPYGFALDRYKLGRCTKKNIPVSAFAVLNYEGIEALYKDVLHHLLEGKKKFIELTKAKPAEDDADSKVISTMISVFKEVVQVSNDASPNLDWAEDNCSS